MAASNASISALLNSSKSGFSPTFTKNSAAKIRFFFETTKKITRNLQIINK